jgi:hypothetical protein
MGWLAAFAGEHVTQATIIELGRKMNSTHSIDQAHSSSLRGTVAAMARTAQQARRIAAQTQTAVVVERNGVLEHLHVPVSHTTDVPSLQAVPTKKDH